jgi:hypothetical protein
MEEEPGDGESQGAQPRIQDLPLPAWLLRKPPRLPRRPAKLLTYEEYERRTEMERCKEIGEERDRTGVKPELIAGPQKHPPLPLGLAPPEMLRQKADEKKPADWEYEKRAEMERRMEVGEERDRTGVKPDLIAGPLKSPPPEECSAPEKVIWPQIEYLGWGAASRGTRTWNKEEGTWCMGSWVGKIAGPLKSASPEEGSAPPEMLRQKNYEKKPTTGEVRHCLPGPSKDWMQSNWYRQGIIDARRLRESRALVRLVLSMSMDEAISSWKKGPEVRVNEPDDARIRGLERLNPEGSHGKSAPGRLIEAMGAVMTVMTAQEDEQHSEHPTAQLVQCDRQETPCPQSRGASIHVAQPGQSVLGHLEQGDLPARKAIQETALKVKQHRDPPAALLAQCDRPIILCSQRRGASMLVTQSANSAPGRLELSEAPAKKTDRKTDRGIAQQVEKRADQHAVQLAQSDRPFKLCSQSRGASMHVTQPVQSAHESTEQRDPPVKKARAQGTTHGKKKHGTTSAGAGGEAAVVEKTKEQGAAQAGQFVGGPTTKGRPKGSNPLGGQYVASPGVSPGVNAAQGMVQMRKEKQGEKRHHRWGQAYTRLKKTALIAAIVWGSFGLTATGSGGEALEAKDESKQKEYGKEHGKGSRKRRQPRKMKKRQKVNRGRRRKADMEPD